MTNSAFRLGRPVFLFTLGLLMWPLVFTVGGITQFYGYLWRPWADYFELTAALVGLVSCGLAPFFTSFRMGRKCLLFVGALGLYAADCFVSALVGMAVFGIPLN